MKPILFLILFATTALGKDDIPVAQFQNVKRQPDGNGDVVVSGELKQWHKVTLTLGGPVAAESDGLGDMAGGSPFTDLALNVTLTHLPTRAAPRATSSRVTSRRMAMRAIAARNPARNGVRISRRTDRACGTTRSPSRRANM